MNLFPFRHPSITNRIQVAAWQRGYCAGIIHGQILMPVVLVISGSSDRMGGQVGFKRRQTGNYVRFGKLPGAK